MATEIFQNIMKWMEDFPLGKVSVVPACVCVCVLYTPLFIR